MHFHKTHEESANRLRKKLFVYLATAMFLLVCSLSIIIFVTFFGHLKNAEDENLVHLTETRAMAVAEWFQRVSDLAVQITSRTRIRQELEKNNQGLISLAEVRSFSEPKLQDAMLLSDELIGIMRLNSRREVVAECGEGIGLHLQNHLEDESLSDTTKILSPRVINGRLVLIVSAPIMSRNGKRQGTDLVLFDTASLCRIATALDSAKKAGAVIIGYRQGEREISYLTPLPRWQNNQSSAAELQEAVGLSMEKGLELHTGTRSAAGMLLAYTPIAEYGWGIIIVQSERKLYLPLYRKMAMIGVLYLTFYLLALFGLWYFLQPLADKLLLHAEMLEQRIKEKTDVLEKEIMERKRSEAALHESEERFRLALKNAPVWVTAQDRQLEYIWAYNQRTEKAEDIVGRFDREIFTAEEAEYVTAIKKRVIENDKEHHEQMWFSLPHRRMFLDVSWEPIHDQSGKVVGVASAAVDLTPIKQVEQELKASLAEKEVLLREIHHRVKNNLQVISSMVNLQANEVRDPSMQPIFQDLIFRVRSMAMVHENLYQSDDLAQVDFAEYIKGLAGYLQRAQETAALGIELNTDLQPVRLPVNIAVPCGLIVNELISNAFKHAFIGRENGTVSISLREASADKIYLSVSDNGVGLGPDVDWEQPQSLGLRIIKMLARQINGHVDVVQDNGSRFTCQFVTTG